MRLLRFRDLIEMGVVKNRMTLARYIKNQGFPRGFYLTPQTRAWREDDVLDWVENRPDTTNVTPRRR